jgi:hypothetical protein
MSLLFVLSVSLQAATQSGAYNALLYKKKDNFGQGYLRYRDSHNHMD